MSMLRVVLTRQKVAHGPDALATPDFDALAAAGATTRHVLIGRLGGFAGLAVGVLLIELSLASDGSAGDRWTAATAGLFALTVGGLLAAAPRLVPIWLMDVMAVFAAALLATLGHLSPTLRPAVPGLYVLIGTMPFALRSWWTALLHAAALGVSYAGLLIAGPAPFAPATRWVMVMGAVVTSGLFIRWLIATLAGRALAEHQARREAETASSELAATSRAKSEFLARMSHELRTPLNVVLGFSDLLAEQLVGPLTRWQAEYVSDIAESARHLVSLVDDVLDPELIERGDVELDIEPVDVHAMLIDAIRMVRERATAGGVAIMIDLTADLGSIDVDGRKVRQAVVNLLVNAVKFTPRGGRVVLSAYRARDVLSIAVYDTGVGIAPDDLERIFEEFQQTESAVEGTGLGLPLARKFVERHGGRLWAQSAPGRGSRFVIELPLRVRAAVPTADAEPSASPTDEHEAFTQPGSAANRMMLARVGAWLSVDGAILCSVFAAVTPVSFPVRLGIAGLAALALAAAIAVQRWGPRVPVIGVECFGPAGIVAVTLLTAYGGRFADLVPLAYGWVTMTTFALWRPRRAVAHLLGIAGCYITVLVLQPGEHPLAQGLATIDVLVVNAAIASWISIRLRRLVAAEQRTRRHAEQIRAQLTSASRHKSAFLANMSHELRTPLNAMIGFTDLLVSGATGPLEPKQMEYLGDIQVSARHLLALINDILDLAKLEAGQLQLSNDAVAVPALLERIAVTAERQAAARGIDIAVTVEPSAEFVHADHQRLEQVLLNLVSNAVKFTPDGGRVDIEARGVADELVVSVRDTGIGILPEQRHRIFEAFSQGRQLADGVPEGTGLGLSLVKGLVELHGGRVSVDSQPERGSNFVVTLPGLAGADVLSMRVVAR